MVERFNTYFYVCYKYIVNKVVRTWKHGLLMLYRRSKVASGRRGNTHSQWQLGFQHLRDKVKVSVSHISDVVPGLRVLA